MHFASISAGRKYIAATRSEHIATAVAATAAAAVVAAATFALVVYVVAASLLFNRPVVYGNDAEITSAVVMKKQFLLSV